MNPTKIHELINALNSNQHTLAVAESCTGGMIAAWITAIPGASSVFKGGIVAYSDEVKVNQLHVAPALLAQHGAVSEPVALAMALGAKKTLGTTWALSVTGISGPSGGSTAKPVGTTCFALSGPDGTHAKTELFDGKNREEIRAQAAEFAISWLLKTVL